jgi:hypothetical protein
VSVWFEVWQEVADRLGGQVAFGGPSFGASMVVTLSGVQLWVTSPMSKAEHESDESRGMRVTAPAPGGERLELDVHRGHVYPLGRALGIQDVLVGDPVFDDRFIVKCNDDELARAWLDDAARAAISATGDAYAFQVLDGRVAVTRSGWAPEDDAAGLEAALQAAVALAGAGTRLLGRWRSAAERLGGRLVVAGGTWGIDGEVVLELVHPVARILVDTRFEALGGRGPRTLWTRARSPRSPGGVQDRWAVHARERRFSSTPRLPEGQLVGDAGFAARWRCLADDPARLSVRLTPARQMLLRDLAPAAVVGEPGEVTAWLPGFVADPARLSRLADLVAELAVDSGAAAGGPYR